MNRKDNPQPWQASDVVRPLAAHEFEHIRQLARRSFGLDLKAGKEELVSSRLQRLVRAGGFRSFHDYYRHIVDDASGLALASMIDALATNHTTFYREPAHFEFLRTEVLPRFRARDCIDVWTAACSTGEEAWTLAFVMNDFLPARQVRIAATDISNRALRFAQHALYPADRCLGMPNGWLERYFDPVERPEPGWQVSAKVRTQASFRRINLVDRYTWPRPFPVIFCRNVMIYFDTATQTEVIRRLTEWLEPGGFLFVGHAESLSRISHSLEYVRPAIYCRPAAGKAGSRR